MYLLTEQEDILFLIQPDQLIMCLESNLLDKDQLYAALNLLFLAVLETSWESALNKLDQAIQILEPEAIRYLQPIYTNTSLEPWEIEDFDNFFYMKHVQTTNPVLCTVLALINSYKALIQIIQIHSMTITAEEIENQKQGFKSSLNLLARSFNICLEL